MDEALLPCPFCGSEARMLEDDGWFRISYGSKGAEAHSDLCPIRNRNPFDEMAYATEAEAITAWNTRATPEAHRAAYEAGLDAVDKALDAFWWGSMSDKAEAHAAIRALKEKSDG